MADLGVTPFQEPPICFSISGWWFGFLLCFHILGILIPTDFYIFQTGWDPQICLGWDMSRRVKSKKKHWMIDLSDLQVTSTINRLTYIYIYQIYIYIYIDRYIYIYYIYILYISIYIYIFKINIEFSHRFSISASIHRRLPGFDQSLDKVKLPSGPSAEGKCPAMSRFQWESHEKSMGNLWEKSKINGKIMENWVNIGVILWWRNALCYVCFAGILDGESSSKSACDDSSHWGTGFCMRQAELVSFPAVTFVHLLATILSIHLLNQKPFV